MLKVPVPGTSHAAGHSFDIVVNYVLTSSLLLPDCQIRRQGLDLAIQTEQKGIIPTLSPPKHII